MPYTIYTKGALTDIPSVSDGADFVRFKFLGGTAFVLFYTFAGFRRAYIATCWESAKDGEPVSLPGVNEKLCVLFTARGRKVDHLKRCVHILTEEQDCGDKAFRLPLLFWYRLGACIQQTGAPRSDVEVLWRAFAKRPLKKLTKNDKKRRLKGL